MYLFFEPFGAVIKYKHKKEVISMLTAEEYAKRREEYEDRLYKLFEEGRITLEELIELLDK